MVSLPRTDKTRHMLYQRARAHAQQSFVSNCVLTRLGGRNCAFCLLLEQCVCVCVYEGGERERVPLRTLHPSRPPYHPMHQHSCQPVHNIPRWEKNCRKYVIYKPVGLGWLGAVQLSSSYSTSSVNPLDQSSQAR